jgi:hypothetical protein|tara:strand:- start:11524 stop:11637 length:114 start_codon:yes stop_codon:yes gene_type:complete
MTVERPKIYSGSIGNKYHSKVKPDTRRKYNTKVKKKK